MINLVVVQLNADWRVTLLHDQGAWKNAAWAIEEMVAGAWQHRAAFRVRHMVLEFVQYRCGQIDQDAATILAGLPERSDRRPAPRYVSKRKRAPTASPRAVAHVAQQFVDWRKNQPRTSRSKEPA